jgi:predicted metalloendopeptidase
VSDLGELLAVAEPGDGVPLGQYFRAVVAALKVRAELQTARTEVLTLRAEVDGVRESLAERESRVVDLEGTLAMRTAQWQKLADRREAP